jgi:hypothetical protein
MARRLRAAIAAMFAFGLAGCFVSPTPLIAPHEAEFPLATPKVIGDVHADGTSSPLRLERQGGVYVLMDANAKTDGKTVPEVKHRFVVRGIGNGLFVAQRFGDNGACPCVFGLIEMSGNRLGVYEFDSFGSSQQLSPEEMARHGVTVDGTSYRLSSFAQTAALFRALLERPRPDEVYVLE